MQRIVLYLILSSVVALVATLPVLLRRHSAAYAFSVFLGYALSGVVVFLVRLPGLPWWANGPVIVLLLSLPAALQPAGRGVRAWYWALLSAAVVGFAVSAIDHFLPRLTGLLSAAA